MEKATSVSTGKQSGTADRIREVAVRLFSEKGYAATGIRDIAQGAGVTTSALYNHMGEKQDLLVAIMRDGLDLLIDGAQTALAAAGDPAEELAGLTRNHVLCNGRNLLDALVSDAEVRALDEPTREQILKMRDVYEALWTDVVRRGVKAGVFHIRDEKLFRLAAIQMCNGVTYWYSPAGAQSLTEIADEFAVLTNAMACSPHPEAAKPGRPGNGSRARRRK